jgi:hypothetical protein
MTRAGSKDTACSLRVRRTRKAVAQIQLLQKTDRDLSPRLNHAGDQVRSRKLQVLAKLDTKHDRLSRQFKARSNQMGVWQTDQALLLGSIHDVDPEETEDFQQSDK